MALTLHLWAWSHTFSPYFAGANSIKFSLFDWLLCWWCDDELVEFLNSDLLVVAPEIWKGSEFSFLDADELMIQAYIQI